MADFERAQNPGGSVLKSWMKSPGALVTEADIAADKVISASLLGSGTDASLVSEESSSGDSSNKQSWLVDPLCGTVPFRSGMPHWGINITLRHEDRLAVGVIALPESHRVLAATAGGGVTLNGNPFEGHDPELPLNEATIGFEIDGGDEWTRLLAPGSSGVSPLAWPGSIGHINTFASAAYPLALVCTGGMSGVVFYTIDSVHLAAGALIAQELGAAVSDDRGNPLDWRSTDPHPVAVIAWPSVHVALIKAMRR
jgi:myo-inositol-1(or 4)-monophosphatase